MSARSRELFGLLPVTLLITAGFTAVLITRSSQINTVTRDLRRLLPRLLPVRARLHPRAPARRRPVHVPARGAAGGVRPGDDLPDRADLRAPAGGVVRVRAAAVLRDDRVPARLPRAGALPLHDRGGEHRPAAPAARARDRRATRTARTSPSTSVPLQFQPAEFAKIGIVVFLASYLRETRDVLVRGRVPRHQPQAPRAAAPDLGPGDGDADPDPGPGQLGDVLRRVPGDALRGHRADLAGGGRAGHLRGRRGVLRQARAARARSRRRSGCTRSVPTW